MRGFGPKYFYFFWSPGKRGCYADLTLLSRCAIAYLRVLINGLKWTLFMMGYGYPY